MRYFIGYLIEGEAASWHIDLTKRISLKFNTWEIYEKIPPHITIFYPFETEDIRPVKELLSGWIKSKSVPGNFVLSGFDHFDDRVVFAKVEADPSTEETVKGLQMSFRKIADTASKENSLPWHPHATLANDVSPKEISQIWDYVQTLEKPSFALAFDNVTIFRSENEKWVVEKSFKFL